MLIDRPDIDALRALDADLVVIGGGVLGVLTALAAAQKGRKVLVLETGHTAFDATAQTQTDDTVLTPDTHHAGALTTQRRLGGAGHLWGGRCVPFDLIDYAARPWLGMDDSAWPISADTLTPYLAPALHLLGAGQAVFHAPPAVQPQNPAFVLDRLERWTNQPRIHLPHMEQISKSALLHLALGVSVTGMERGETGSIQALNLWIDGTTAQLPVRDVVLAAGGVAATRLLLAMQAQTPALFGGVDGPLGRFYMGHVNGQIADITVTNLGFHNDFDYHVDGHGSYVRRRIAPSDATQQALGLSNMTFWPVVPEIADPAHRSGPLSAVFLGLSMPVLGKKIIAEAIRLKHIGPGPYRRWPHIWNLIRDPVSTLAFVPRFLWQRKYARYRVPGFFLRNPGARYGLEFHAEHLPHPDSRITLDPARRDRTGLPHARIDFRFAPADVAPILRAHTALDEWLRAEGFGRLDYRYPADALGAGVLKEAQHGNHQIGTIRMGTGPSQGPAQGVVDGFGTCFDIPNLHVVSTAILPTSSQANPTLTAAQLGLRLVDHLYPERPS